MRKPKLSVPVSGVSYAVIEKSGILKAAVNGYFGWTNVWAANFPDLVRRIKQVRSGGQ